MDLRDKIFLTITTHPDFSWQHKIWEVDRLGIREVSVFPTFIKQKERKKLYKALERSKIKHIPHVHIRDDFEKWELEFFYKKYGTRFFNIHEHSFDDLYKWRGYEKYIYLEYNYDNKISNLVRVKKINGICVDFSHFWASKYRDTDEYDKTIADLNKFKVGCNHLNGYSYKFKRDLHYVSNIRQFDYLKNIPRKYFSNVISIEVNNSIVDQLFFKKHLINLLKNS